MLFLYTTTKTLEEAETIARKLLETKTAGSVSIFPVKTLALNSKDQIQETQEFEIMVRTIDEKVKSAEEIIKANFKNGLPCIATLSLYRMNREYKEWLITHIA